MAHNTASQPASQLQATIIHGLADTLFIPSHVRDPARRGKGREESEVEIMKGEGRKGL